jgi:hypothetical protein
MVRWRDSLRRTPFRVVAGLALLAGLFGAEDRRSAPVGLPARIEGLVLPGPELEARPPEKPPEKKGIRRPPLVLRVAAVYPHGTAHRYDLVWYALEPGRYDLRDHLRRKDGHSIQHLPPLPVEASSVLPPGQVLPNPLNPRPSPWVGGYRLVLVAGGVVWVLGLLAVLFVGRRRRPAAEQTQAAPVTAADRLRPLVESAVAGTLTPGQWAELERTLLAFWRRRLGLEQAAPAEAMARLRRHPEAGQLLEQLEAWLHRPGPPGPVDLAALLRPYQEAETTGVGG